MKDIFFVFLGNTQANLPFFKKLMKQKQEKLAAV